MMWREQGKTRRWPCGHCAWFRPFRPATGLYHAEEAWSRQGPPARLAHGVDVVRPRESARPDFLRIAFDCLLDRRAELAEAFDEFRHPRRQSEHILQDQNLAITGDAGANADRRDCDLRRDAPPERFGDRFKHDGKAAGIRHRARVRFDRRPIALVAALRAER